MEEEKRSFAGKFFETAKETIKFIIISLIIVVPFRMFVAQPFIVSGASMEPNFQNGDYLIVDELSYRLRTPERGEVVILKAKNSAVFYIKRVIGLPNEKIEIRDGKVYVYYAYNEAELLHGEQGEANKSGLKLQEEYLNGAETYPDETFNLKNDEYLVLGDNRTQSLDSRSFGAIKRKSIIGRALVRLWPISDISFAKWQKN